MFDFSHSFFKPVWRRVIIVGICAGWAIFEGVTGGPFWAIIFFALAGLSYWKLFLDQDNLQKLEDKDNH